jgi:hypothetical protein
VTNAHVAIVGSGSLALETVCALAGIQGEGLVSVVARSSQSANRVAKIGSLRAWAAGSRRRFVGAGLADLSQSVEDLAADVVVLMASLQSPWEADDRPSAWTDAMLRCGVALTLPLQASLALEVGASVARTGGLFVNACLPDLVNPLLVAAEVPVLTGVGNVGVLALGAAEALGAPLASLSVLGHHVHLDRPADNVSEALVWTADAAPVDAAAALTAIRGVPRRLRNRLTGLVSAQVVAALADALPLDTSVPGPHGLPGGYPVRIRDRMVDPVPPPGWSLERCVAINDEWSRADGVRVLNRSVVISEHVRPALALVAPWLAAGFDVRDTDHVVADLLRTRREFRKESGRNTACLTA